MPSLCRQTTRVQGAAPRLWKVRTLLCKFHMTLEKASGLFFLWIVLTPDVFLGTFSRHLYLWTGSVELPPSKKENSLEEFHNHFVQVEMKLWGLWQRRVRPRNLLQLQGNDQTEPFPVAEHSWPAIGMFSVFIHWGLCPGQPRGAAGINVPQSLHVC